MVNVWLESFKQLSNLLTEGAATLFKYDASSLGEINLFKCVGRLYQRMREEATNANQETVKAFITQAIVKQELPQSAT